MKSNYRKIGDFIKPIKKKNTEGLTDLQGINIDKYFMPSVANVVGTNLSRYKVISYNQFACNRMHVGRDEKLPIALSKRKDNFIVSPAYDVFEIIDTEELHPDYLMMWFSRKEFDRNTWFYTDGDVRGGLKWDAFCNMELPVPSLDQQKAIVQEYQTITQRIQLNERINQQLEATAQTLYKHWFVDFEFPNENGQPYRSSGGKMVYNEVLDKDVPVGWEVGSLEDIANIKMGQSPSGSSYNQIGNGEIFYQGRTEFGFRFPSVKNYTTEPKRMANIGDILMTVRAPVGDFNITNRKCCIGRGLAAINSKIDANSFLYYHLMLIIKSSTSNDEGTIFGSINKDELKGLKTIIPQNIIVLNFNKKVATIDKSIKNYCLQLEQLQLFKEILLARISKN